MTKTPEELTDDWKAGKLEFGKDYYIKTVYDEVLIDCYEQQYDESHYPHGMGFDNFSKNMIKRILAPVPTYDEYRTMQAELADSSKKIEELEDRIADLEKENKQLEEDTGYGWHTAGIEIDKNNKLRWLLKQCIPAAKFARDLGLVAMIEKAISESEEHSNMLKNPENFNVSAENVKGDNR